MASTRRKKKRKPSESMERFKPPLMFVESPIQGSKHFCTPVQAARNPYMAPSIPVDDLSDKWVSPQFTLNTNSPIFEETRRRTRKNRNPENEKEKEQTTKKTIAPLDFEHKVRSACKKISTKTTLRRSTRLKAKKLDKHEHFLFGKGNSMTPKHLREMKVLAPETPECVTMIPVVLRKLRQGHDKIEKFKVLEKNK